MMRWIAKVLLGITDRTDGYDEVGLQRLETEVLSTARTVKLLGAMASFVYLTVLLVGMFFIHNPNFMYLLVGVLVMPLVLFLSHYLAEFLSESIATTLKAKRLRLLANRDERPPFLVLRSFAEGHLCHVFWQPKTPRSAAPYYRRFYLADLAHAAIPLGQMIALGDPNTPSAKIKFGQWTNALKSAFIPLDILFVPSSPSDWVTKFVDLASVAKAIFLIPGTTPGVLEELHLVRTNGWTKKTIVFMPPSATDEYFNVWDQNRLTKEWTAIQERWRTEDLALPNYDPGGMLYIPNSDFSVSKSAPIGNVYDSTALQKRIAILLPHLRGKTSPIKDVTRLVQ